MTLTNHILSLIVAAILACSTAYGQTTDSLLKLAEAPALPTQLKLTTPLPSPEKMAVSDIVSTGKFKPTSKLNLYQLPYSRTLSLPNWGRLWANTGVLMAGGVATMIILESMPEEATAWNRAENSKTPIFKRWLRNVKKGPTWDGDKFIFNFVLHPYAGAAYYMSARSCGFNCWGSFLYSFCVSSIFWEYGFESFNEIPSMQDLVITPVIGSLIGEGFYLAKRKIVSNGYRLLGSEILGHAAAFICDPVNEALGYLRGDQRSAKKYVKARAGEGLGGQAWIMPGRNGNIEGGFSLTYTF